MFSKFEKKLIVAALVFVAIYLGAAVMTFHEKYGEQDRVERIESPDLTPAEGRLLMVELLLPMAILLTLTVCYIVVRKQRAKRYLKLDDPEDEIDSDTTLQ
jgi:hypothetical protein